MSIVITTGIYVNELDSYNFEQGLYVINNKKEVFLTLKIIAVGYIINIATGWLYLYDDLFIEKIGPVYIIEDEGLIKILVKKKD